MRERAARLDCTIINGAGEGVVLKLEIKKKLNLISYRPSLRHCRWPLDAVVYSGAYRRGCLLPC